MGDDLSILTDQLDMISPEEAAIVITTQLNIANKDWGSTAGKVASTIWADSSEKLQGDEEFPEGHHPQARSLICLEKLSYY